MTGMTEIPEEAVRAAVAAYAKDAYLDGKPIDGDERVIRCALEAAIPVLRAHYAARLEAKDSPLCDCRHDGGSEPTSPRTRLPMAHTASA